MVDDRRARPHRLNFAPSPPTGDVTLALQENLRRLEDFFLPYGGGAPHPELLARFLGGQWFEAPVAASTGSTEADDTVFMHNLGRVPQVVLLSIPTDGGAGRVQGLPAGSDGSGGANVGPWTQTTVSVRASVTGTYQVIVL